ncbi:ribosome small subunit-dependent GTPase A [Bacillus carboniphilus]|uniref:Small ribosomal subunit biogenesis GTPase RsgA n=1 Tax=Bacillus carboniphilus TaxID=86663 RepID=A0ABY9JXR0_9BACI|nr:ribosome small subunit-dependent GTPase A [Bacillus carboniphilus]WLR43574.1 ribosome small subunit-dependent GTPase A [Bacillus carboniphilus]
MPTGKIIKALSGFYYVLDRKGVISCRGRGVFRNNKTTLLVGDEVIYEKADDLSGYIMEVLPRKNELIRPPISNVDQAILVFSALEPDFSSKLLDRFLVLVESNNIKPIICVTKMDLVKNDTIKEVVEEYRKIGYNVILTSVREEQSLKEIKAFISNKISVFAGQSGVGKSSLLNAINPTLNIETNTISESLGRGKHTTRHVELLNVNDGLVADTPGFSSLDFEEITKEELGDYFIEIKEKSAECRFRGCLHTAEPKCAVKSAVEHGEIAEFRYQHYKEFLDEINERKPRY